MRMRFVSINGSAQSAATKSDFAGIQEFPAPEERNEEAVPIESAFDGCGVCQRSNVESAVHQRRLPQSAGCGPAAQPAYLRRSLGPMVIDVSPDARPVGPRRSRQVRRTVCLARAQLR